MNFSLLLYSFACICSVSNVHTKQTSEVIQLDLNKIKMNQTFQINFTSNCTKQTTNNSDDFVTPMQKNLDAYFVDQSKLNKEFASDLHQLSKHIADLLTRFRQLHDDLYSYIALNDFSPPPTSPDNK